MLVDVRIDGLFALDALPARNVTFWTAWTDGRLCGCGALRELDAATGEVKSMRTRAACLRQRVGPAAPLRILPERRPAV